MRRALTLIALAMLSMGCAPDEVEVRDAWVRAMPPGAGATALYLAVENGTDQAIRITSVTSPWFRRSMFHRTVLEDGVARMVHEPALVVPAGARLRLEPGGLHVMLMGPQQPLAEGAEVPISLVLEDGRMLEVLATVGSGD